MRTFLREAYSPETVRAEIDVPGSRFFIARMADAAVLLVGTMLWLS